MSIEFIYQLHISPLSKPELKKSIVKTKVIEAKAGIFRRQLRLHYKMASIIPVLVYGDQLKFNHRLERSLWT